MAEVTVAQAVPLKGVPNVELVAVGSWKASTGPVTITVDDLASAVAALDCPGVHNPVLKLGHEEPDPDAAKVRWDGEPAVGWISNMRLSANRAKILGDYTGMPAWLADVLPSAYPQRSVEIQHDFVCQIGHTHPFVITAVSLLGVMPPAVGVIRSLNDVQALYTLAAPPPVTGGQGHTLTVTLTEGPLRRQPTPVELATATDFERLQQQWEGSLDELLIAYAAVAAGQRTEIEAQVQQAVDGGAYAELAAITVTSAVAASLLAAAMRAAALDAALDMAAEARRQGVMPGEYELDLDWLDEVAAAVAAAMATSTAATAGRNAAQLVAPGATGRDIAERVGDDLAAMTDRFWRDHLGGALSTAQNVGRLTVLDAAPAADYYASEVLDAGTCQPCRQVDGARFPTLAQAREAYGAGGYTACRAGPRCRGTVIALWAADLTAAPATLTVTAHLSLRTGETTMPTTVKAAVSVEDISRAYYKDAGYSMWITAMHVDPLELVVCDDASGDYFRVPITVGSGDEFTFGDPAKVSIQYVDVPDKESGKTKASGLAYADDGGSLRLSALSWRDRTAALTVVGGEPPPDPDPDPAPGPPLPARETPAQAAARIHAAAQRAATPSPPPASPGGGSVSEPKKEASGMPVDAAKLREALGLSADASDTDVLSGLLGALNGAGTQPPKPDDDPDPAKLSGPPKVPTRAGEAGAILLDPDTLSQLQDSARKGERAWAQLKRNERDRVLDEAVRLGKFPPMRREYWVTLWDRDPDGTREAIDALASNVIPVLSPGYLGDDSANRSADALAYEGLFGKEDR